MSIFLLSLPLLPTLVLPRFSSSTALVSSTRPTASHQQQSDLRLDCQQRLTVSPPSCVAEGHDSPLPLPVLQVIWCEGCLPSPGSDTSEVLPLGALTSENKSTRTTEAHLAWHLQHVGVETHDLVVEQAQKLCKALATTVKASRCSQDSISSCCISINTFSVKISASDCLLIFKGMLNIHSNKVSTHVWLQTESSHSQANAEHPEKFVGKE